VGLPAGDAGLTRIELHHRFDQPWAIVEDSPDRYSFNQKTQEYPFVHFLRHIGDEGGECSDDGEGDESDEVDGKSSGDGGSGEDSSGGKDDKVGKGECDGGEDGNDLGDSFAGPSEDVPCDDNHNTHDNRECLGDKNLLHGISCRVSVVSLVVKERSSGIL